jgi:hypothetical protein
VGHVNLRTPESFEALQRLMAVRKTIEYWMTIPCRDQPALP